MILRDTLLTSLACLMLISCGIENSFINNALSQWKYFTINYKDDSNELNSFKYEFEIPLPKNAEIDFYLGKNAWIDSDKYLNKDNNNNFFSFEIEPNEWKSGWTLETFLENKCNGENKLKSENIINLLTEKDGIQIYEVWNVCDAEGEKDYIIRTEEYLYYVNVISKKTDDVRRLIQYSITNIRRN